MPLTMVQAGEPVQVKKILGKKDVKSFLESLGFVNGAEVSIVSQIMGNIIVSIKDTRIAIDKDMAKYILV